MLNKRLIGLMPDVLLRTARSVFFQWLALLCSAAVTVCICLYLDRLSQFRSADLQFTASIAAATVAAVFLRCIFTSAYSNNSARTARRIKRVLREKIFDRLCLIGVSYSKSISTAEAVQVGVEGAEQLEAYFSQYLPQLFYALASTITVFVFLCFSCFKAAVILLICVPVIPLSIIGVQKIAKKLLSKYWDSYTDLGDSFLENIQGLTTLKIYRSDALKHEEMNANAERFRNATMRVLIMQLNSISIMDIIAYGGAAIGIIAAVSELSYGNITFFRAMVTVLLSAEFFLPLRQLGSFFHVAMNGAAAADKIFRILDAHPASDPRSCKISGSAIKLDKLSFSYDGGKNALDRISLSIPEHGLFALCGKSGCGKSTIAKLLTGQLTGYGGSIKIGGTELSEINEKELLDNITLVSHDSHIFKGTVRYNLLMGNPDADAEQMRCALEKVRLWDFLSGENGLDTEISEQGANLSGGQRQRLALARALLHDTNIYIFDEAASNIDAESENAVNSVIAELSRSRLVIVISHRLLSITNADKIFILKDGRLAGQGTHSELTADNPVYCELWNTQQSLERYMEDSKDE